MKRLKKAMLLPIRSLAHKLNYNRIFYWADGKLYELRKVYVMPQLYYRLLFKISMRLAGIKFMRQFANRAIHTIPYNIRFALA